MRIFRVGYIAALVVGGAAASSQGETGGGLTPQYQARLNQEIQQCAQRVNRAGSAQERCQLQQELCKKLLQAEDFSHALDVATTIYSTRGVEAERRAAHHFMIAQIHAMQMEASTSIQEMTSCREKALKVAHEVVSQGYPSHWMVGEAAAGLIRELQDPVKQRTVHAKVAKRQSGGVTADLARVATAQSHVLAHSTNVAKQKMLSGRTGTQFGRTTAQPAASALAAKLGGTKVTFSSGRGSTSTGKTAKVSYSSSGARVSEATGTSPGKLRTGPLKEPVVIDMNGQHKASKRTALEKEEAAAAKAGIGSPSAKPSKSRKGAS